MKRQPPPLPFRPSSARFSLSEQSPPFSPPAYRTTPLPLVSKPSPSDVAYSSHPIDSPSIEINWRTSPVALTAQKSPSDPIQSEATPRREGREADLALPIPSHWVAIAPPAPYSSASATRQSESVSPKRTEPNSFSKVLRVLFIVLIISALALAAALIYAAISHSWIFSSNSSPSSDANDSISDSSSLLSSDSQELSGSIVYSSESTPSGESTDSSSSDPQAPQSAFNPNSTRFYENTAPNAWIGLKFPSQFALTEFNSFQNVRTYAISLVHRFKSIPIQSVHSPLPLQLQC
jgi:hypothetical protein